MSGIFISYRRDDAAPYAGRLYDRLSAHFGPGRVFMDVDDIEAGADFIKRIEDSAGDCDALIAVIGKGWLAAVDERGQRRLTDPADFVAMEVGAALRRDRMVIPVLVGGAAMPAAEELPPGLRELANRNAVVLHDRSFQRDAEFVVQALAKLPGLAGVRERRRNLPAAGSKRRLARRLLWKVPLILMLAGFAVWWQWRQEKGAATPQPSAETPAWASSLAGVWQSEVTYDWGVSQRERFFFQPEAGKLFGTATFLGSKRGIEDGKFSAGGFSFFTRFQEVLGSTIQERRNRYFGSIVEDQIHLRLEDDRGNPPLQMRLTRVRESG